MNFVFVENWKNQGTSNVYKIQIDNSHCQLILRWNHMLSYMVIEPMNDRLGIQWKNKNFGFNPRMLN